MSDEQKPKKVNPFIEVKVKCPVCEKESPQFYVKSKLYQPVEIEKDHHVLSYKWTDDNFLHIKPENFYIWHCPYCNFADENEVFRGKIDKLWKGKLELMSSKVIKASKNPDCFLVKLGKEIDCTELPVTNETAILKHILACYVQEGFLSPNNKMPGKLAKFYLRLAWLFRERKNLEKNIEKIPNGYMSFEEYLVAQKKYWEEIPLSEEEALGKAITQYGTMLDYAGKEDNVKKEITLMLLILNLNRKIGELDTAFTYVRSIFSTAMKTRQATKNSLDKGTQSGKLSTQQIEQMRGMIAWLSNIIDDASSEGDSINEEIFWDEYEKARERALEVDPMLPKKVMDTLREEKFHEITCRKIATLCKPPKGVKVLQHLPTKEELKAKSENTTPTQTTENKTAETDDEQET